MRLELGPITWDYDQLLPPQLASICREKKDKKSIKKTTGGKERPSLTRIKGTLVQI